MTRQEQDNRYEFKFVFNDASWLSMATRAFTGYGFVEHHHPSRWINNLYFDTPLLDNVSETLGGLEKRAKLRLRWYDDQGLIRIEKKEREGLAIRKKIWLLQDDAPKDGDLQKQFLKSMHHKLDRDAMSLFGSWAAITLYNRYFRQYYVSPETGIRVTFDTQITSVPQQYSNRFRFSSSKSFENVHVLEIKAPLDQYEELAKLCQKFPQGRQSFSKYVIGTELFRF